MDAIRWISVGGRQRKEGRCWRGATALREPGENGGLQGVIGGVLGIKHILAPESARSRHPRQTLNGTSQHRDSAAPSSNKHQPPSRRQHQHAAIQLHLPTSSTASLNQHALLFLPPINHPTERVMFLRSGPPFVAGPPAKLRGSFGMRKRNSRQMASLDLSAYSSDSRTHLPILHLIYPARSV